MILFNRHEEKNVPEEEIKVIPGKNDWLLKILDRTGLDLEAIREEVEFLLWEYEFDNPDATEAEISQGVTKKLITWSSVKTGSLGGATAAPASIPILGTIGTALLGTTVDVAYLIRTQIELCYAISAAYEVHIEKERLKAITLVLLGFSDNEDVAVEIATTSLKTVVNELADKYLSRTLAVSASETASKLVPKFFSKTSRLIPFIGVPLTVSMNVSSTVKVGRQARDYFSEY
uniref:Magnetosome protein Mad31 n=1 Tax=Candidatus Magnetananas rongchengensis TaxID=1463558 RepID=A0A3S6IW38_9BACT|nr:magnetosome protein Mad31 [Candidatus Magnetananas rongchenensis]